jgi:hypothetical protein
MGISREVNELRGAGALLFVAVQHESKYGSAHPPIQAFFVAMQQI